VGHSRVSLFPGRGGFGVGRNGSNGLRFCAIARGAGVFVFGGEEGGIVAAGEGFSERIADAAELGEELGAGGFDLGLTGPAAMVWCTTPAGT